MSNRSYRYLNKGTGLMYSPLFNAIKEGQKRAPANQWGNIIKSLRNKGVKESEIDDSGLAGYIDTLEGPVTKEMLLAHLEATSHLIKEIDLSRHKYKKYSYAQHGSDYMETLYVLAGEDDFLKDKLLDVQFELEDLDFYPERLMENPLLAHELYEQEQDIQNKINLLTAKSQISVAHWSGQKDPDTGEEIKSLLFHTRTSLQEDGETFFVEEIQSDWAQRGRQSKWEEIPRAPWVTNTDLWSGLAFRRLMQRAAENPHVKKFTWITGDYRNGGNFIQDDGLNDFYIKVIGKAVNRALSGTGEKADFAKVKLGNKEVSLPSFNMTDKVREKLKKAQPLYSRDYAMREISERALKELTPEMKRLVGTAHHMIGNAAQIKLLSRMVDHSNTPVSGRFLGQCIEVSLAGQNPARALAHESWHYTYDHLLTPSERVASDHAFTATSPLLARLKEVMRENGLSANAIEQCSNPQEAAAHAFSLWVDGQFQLNSSKSEKLEHAFKKAETSFEALREQVSSSYDMIDELNDQSSPEAELLVLFEHLRDGHLAHRVELTQPPSPG